MDYDLIIIGGGPAGVAAGVYAARKKLNTLFLTYDFGGQSMVSAEIQNWIGTKTISGEALATQLREHLLVYEGDSLTVKSGVKAKQVIKSDEGFIAITDEDEKFVGKTILIATGATRRKLTVPGAVEFEQKGITYCATCDGPLFAGQAVVVIGGGNAAFETVAQLLAYCPSVTLLHHGAEYKADPITVEKIKRNPKATLITNAETISFQGDKFVSSLIYKDKISGEEKSLATQGVFVEIGLVPNTAPVKDLVKVNQYDSIVTDPRNQQTSLPGIWAAGDCTDGLYHQNNIAAGDAVKALEDIYSYLHLKG